MKKNLFKKLVAGISSIAMLASLGAVPVFAEEVTVASASISGSTLMTIGADANTAAENTYTVTLTDDSGTEITKDDLGSISVSWEIDGFKTENDITDNSYCDSYGSFSSKTTDDLTAVFNVKDSSMNFYGMLTATVTYSGGTITAEKAVAAISNTDIPSNRILPEAGYPGDMNEYPDALVGYIASQNTYIKDGTDAILGGWNMSGSDGSRQATLMSDETGKFIRIAGPTAKKSHVFANVITSPSTQVIFEQDIRYNNSSGEISFTHGNSFWVNNGYYKPVYVTYDGSTIKLNGTAITNNDEAVSISENTWYRIVLSADKTNETCYVKVYDNNGNFLGGTDNIAWAASCTPTYYGITGNTVDFNSYKAYYPVADESTYTLTTTADTLSIPNGDSAELTASLKTAEGYDITGAATWQVLEEDMQTGVIVTPDESDSHKAVVALADGAVAGEATVQVNIGGYTKTVTLNITSNEESVKFTASKTSVSIPLDASKNETVQYTASIIDGNGDDTGKAVTLAVYDKTNTEEITLPSGITFDAGTGVLTVTADAKAYTFVIRATGQNSDGETITKSVKVTVHGLEFDFGAGTDEDVVEGNTAVTPDTTYTETSGYGITGTVTAGGTASTTDSTSDYLEGAMTFKANVQAGKIYAVDITYQGTLTAEPVNSDLAAYSLGSQTELVTATYTIPVIDDVLELVIADYSYTDNDETVTATAQIASIVITKNADKTADEKPTIYHIGDSTSANNGSWAYVLNNTYGSYEDLSELAVFKNVGAGGRNLCTYYTQGKLAGVLNSIKPGDILMLGNMGTNGMGSYFEADFNYYLDAAETLGARIIINSYTPHGAVGSYTSGYDSTTQTFESYRKDSYDNIVRAIAAERAENDENYLGFVDIGKRADAAFNAYVDDYAANGYESRDAAAQAIIACFPDHNHYNSDSLARELMLDGYGEAEGTVAGIVDVLSNSVTVTAEQVSTSANEGSTPAAAYIAEFDDYKGYLNTLTWTINKADESDQIIKEEELDGTYIASGSFVVGLVLTVSNLELLGIVTATLN